MQKVGFLQSNEKFFFSNGLIGVIVLVAVTNTLVGFAQEFRDEKTMESLRNMTSPTTIVIKNDSLILVPTRNIVVLSSFATTALL